MADRRTKNALHATIVERVDGDATEASTCTELVAWARGDGRTTASDDTEYATVHGVPMMPHDYARFAPNTWLNDTCVDAFLSLVETRFGERVHVLNAFFASVFGRRGHVRRSQLAAYARMERLGEARALNGGRLPCILAPVNVRSASHWVLMRIDATHALVRVYDSLGDASVATSDDILRPVARLSRELKRAGYVADDVRWTVRMAHVPRQPNSYDCGVLVCMYALQVGHDVEEGYVDEDEEEATSPAKRRRTEHSSDDCASFRAHVAVSVLSGQLTR